MHSNGGANVTSLKGTLAGYGKVWFDPKGIANILSLSRVAKKYRITYDSEEGNRFVVTKSDGSKRIFTQSDTG